MSRKLTHETKVVIGSTLFAFASSAFLYIIPAHPLDPHLLRGNFRKGMGLSWVRSVKFAGELRDARLYEDDRELGPKDGETIDIAEQGGGRFRLYRDPTDYLAPILIFSTSDGTDPNTNGHMYRLK